MPTNEAYECPRYGKGFKEVGACHDETTGELSECGECILSLLCAGVPGFEVISCDDTQPGQTYGLSGRDHLLLYYLRKS